MSVFAAHSFFIKPPAKLGAIFLILLMNLSLVGLSHGQAPTKAAAQPPEPPSSGARRVYEANKDKLMQIRVLVAGAQSQSSAGSGFFVTPEGLAITNYHVISQLIWEPERYRAEYVLTNQARGNVSVVAIDVQHDLAVVRLEGKPATGAWPVLSFAPDDSLQQGDRVFSLGNPLDLGFAIAEGTYNGLPERSLYPQLLFTGAMNPGVSGGPAIDEAGRVVGVNVAGYGRSAELTNFQVPVKFARELLARAQGRPSATLTQLRADLRGQLMIHQNVMMDAMHAGQWSTEPLGPYRIPVIPNTLARCWGEASDAAKKNYRFESSRCDLSSALYLQGNLRTGSVSLQHEVSSSSTLSALRFANMRSKSMSNESHLYSPHNRHRTAARCTEDFVTNGTMPFRAVVCIRGYRKLEGLFDISTMVVTMDAEREGLESVLTLSGVELRRGLRESKKFIEAITRPDNRPVPIFKRAVPGEKK
jgi:serine protease Do